MAASGDRVPATARVSVPDRALRRVVVTGGAGFIGANLCARLLRSGSAEHVVVVDDLSTGRLDNLSGVVGVDVREGSILDAACLERAVSGADAVVHLAARPSVARSLDDPIATHEVNATGTLRVLEAARSNGGVPVIMASSSSVYGARVALPAREDVAPAPMSPYAASKLAGEGYASAYARSFALPVLVFRFFNVFGPLQRADHAYAAVVPAFVSAALRGEALSVHGDGHQTRDFTYVDSVTSILAGALHARWGDMGPVNLAFGGRHSVLELVDALETILGAPLPRRHGPSRSGDVPHSQADQTKLRAMFPDVEPVAWEDGLRATVAWFRALEPAAACRGSDAGST